MFCLSIERAAVCWQLSSKSVHSIFLIFCKLPGIYSSQKVAIFLFIYLFIYYFIYLLFFLRTGGEICFCLLCGNNGLQNSVFYVLHKGKLSGMEENKTSLIKCKCGGVVISQSDYDPLINTIFPELTLFFPMFPFDPPENIRKPKVF